MYVPLITLTFSINAAGLKLYERKAFLRTQMFRTEITYIHPIFSPKMAYMKPHFSILLISLLLACTNDKKVTYKEEHEDGTTTTTTVDQGNYAQSAEAIEAQMNALKQLPPLSIDELKSMLPDQLNGMKRTKFNANSAMGFAMVQGEYKNDDQSEIQLVIYDCAGDAGSAIYASTYWTRMNMQSESDKGYMKTVDFMDGKAIEAMENNHREASLTYFTKDRFLVVLTGRNVPVDVLKQSAKGLNLQV